MLFCVWPNPFESLFGFAFENWLVVSIYKDSPVFQSLASFDIGSRKALRVSLCPQNYIWMINLETRLRDGVFPESSLLFTDILNLISQPNQTKKSTECVVRALVYMSCLTFTCEKNRWTHQSSVNHIECLGLSVYKRKMFTLTRIWIVGKAFWMWSHNNHLI